MWVCEVLGAMLQSPTLLHHPANSPRLMAKAVHSLVFHTLFTRHCNVSMEYTVMPASAARRGSSFQYAVHCSKQKSRSI